MEDCEKEKSALLAVLSGDLGVDHASILSSAHRLTELHSEVREGRGEGGKEEREREREGGRRGEVMLIFTHLWPDSQKTIMDIHVRFTISTYSHMSPTEQT